MKSICCFIIPFIMAASACSSQSKNALVTTANGKVQGYTMHDVNIYKGIPFAKPPVGQLRWRAPQTLENWNDVKVCTTFSASPFQPLPAPFYCWTEEFIAPPSPLSEDCLYLNVWTDAKTPSQKKPVLVWIYGGGFGSGSAACDVYDGAELAKRGVVFVSINYRVGPFGFMAHPDLSKEQNGASGNYGLLDLVAALKWVQANIGAFGGDPAQVTIAGQSAGSMSVHALLASPLAKGLFRGAILQSGSLFSRLVSPLETAEKAGLAIQKATGAADLAAMRLLPADEVLKASQALQGMRMAPNLDGYVIPQNLEAHFENGRHNDVPLMAGWVLGDAALVSATEATAVKFQEEVQRDYGPAANEFFTVFPAATNDEAAQSKGKLSLLQFAGFPSFKTAVYNKSPVYIYESRYVPTDKPGFPNYGAFHTSEVPFALHTLHLWKRPWQAQDYQLQELMSGYWLQFVKTGNPNTAGMPEWKAFDSTTQDIFVFDKQSAPTKGLYKREFAVMQKQVLAGRTLPDSGR